MLALTPHHRLCIAIEPADFRKGIDGLAAVCRLQLKADPFAGTVFVFRNKTSTAVKILSFDGNGFWLIQKRFSKGRLRGWPGHPAQPVKAVELLLMLQQGTPTSLPADWRPLPDNSRATIARGIAVPPPDAVAMPLNNDGHYVGPNNR